MVSSRYSALSALAYSDIFDYPLTLEEVWFYAVHKPLTKREVESLLSNSELVKEKDGYYCFTGRQEIIKRRIIRKHVSKRKQEIAKDIAGILASIPTIYFIGISGGLAMNNTDADDDIDFFIITKKDTIWITRLLFLVFLIFMGKWRKRTDTDAKDKICINMLLDESHISLSAQKDIYLAHEVVQVIPLIQRRNIYSKFIETNIWVRNFLPNVFKKKVLEVKTLKTSWIENIIGVVEPLAKYIQLVYMRNHKTTEIITDSLLAFHPKNYRMLVLEEYKKRLKKYHIQ